MSIIRVGLAENDKFADGYDAIFNKKKKKARKPASTKSEKTSTKKKKTKK